jgi:glycosyltransferase involved in cell wall biosynthesis
LPSAYESFGLVIAEAWSAGTPVVTSDVPVLAERVAESGGGVTAAREPAALASALAGLLADRPGRAGSARPVAPTGRSA